MHEPEELWKSTGRTSKPETTEDTVISNVSPTSFRIEVSNQESRASHVDTYYFGFVLEVFYRDGTTLVRDFGADKVPVPTGNDWHFLRRRQSVPWHVDVPSGWKSLDEARAIKYYENNVERTVPEQILATNVPSDRQIVRAEWTRGE